MLLPVLILLGTKKINKTTIKLKKFDNTNIENLVNNHRNLKYILQNNNMSIMKFLAYKKQKQWNERNLIIPILKFL